ncbi:MAG: DUF1501 domain-containing protein [Chitinophagales bacterium]|nr:DUF1501 domain-containing protein [Chitinophagales bacterium]
MRRKEFIKNAAITTFFPFVLNALSACNRLGVRGQNRIIVLIQLVGGNDGLNTLIPIDQYKNLSLARPNLIIPENKILQLNGFSNVGLHPSLEAIKDLFDNKLAGFIQGVGYENPNYSHFRSSDIWLTGSDSSKVLYTGWMARYLETIFKNYPSGYPNESNTDPPAIKIGDTGTYLFQGKSMDMSIVIDPATPFNVSDVSLEEGDLNTLAGQEVRSIREILLQTNKYSAVIKNALSTTIQHSKLYPKEGENTLADQLKVVAKLIKGGLKTSVYLVELKGFDTHDGQADTKDPSKGWHADLLKKLSQGVNCFWDDINKIGRENDVLGMTFSEFGRRIMANGGNGTDHGSSQPILFFGNQINSSIVGSNPIIPDKISAEDNLSLQYDYRSVFGSVLKQWGGASPSSVNEVFGEHFQDIKIIV